MFFKLLNLNLDEDMKLKEAVEEEIATEEDWDNFFADRYYCDCIEYDDLDALVEFEGVEYTNTSGPMNDYGDTGEREWHEAGYVQDWIFDHDLTEEDVAKYLNKKVEEVTKKDLETLDVEALDEFLHELYWDEAVEDAKENATLDDVDFIDLDDEN